MVQFLKKNSQMYNKESHPIKIENINGARGFSLVKLEPAKKYPTETNNLLLLLLCERQPLNSLHSQIFQYLYNTTKEYIKSK